MKTVIVMKADLSIASKYEGSPNQAAYGGPWGWSDHSIHIEVPSELDIDAIKAELDQDNNIILVEDTVKAVAKAESQKESQLEKIRTLREPKLKKCDQLINIAFLNAWTASEKTELKDYRQALLDITEPLKQESVVSDEDIASIVWPTEPTEA